MNNLSSASNHNGGAIHFGKDGKLYIAVGENADPAHSQTLANLLGKMLRLNANGTIPTDNPFYNTASGVNRAIWALGLRNPFTFAVQPGTGRMFINDVGAGSWEEINEAVAGANYGWPNCEGTCNPSNPSYRDPLFRYPHGSGTSAGFCIAGGAFYNPSTVQYPAAYVGVYFFADYVNGWIRKLDPANGNAVTVFATGITSPVDLKVSADGRLHYLTRDGGGVVSAIRYTSSQAPQITQQPSDQTVQVGQPATFTVTATGSQPLSYQWQRNGVNIPGATASSYTLTSTTAADDGAAFRCVVSNAYGTAASNPAYLHISSDDPPTGTITSPANGTLYAAGDTIQFAGTATDPEDGNLPASAFSWTIVFHHDTHTHPFLGPSNGVRSGSFTIPNEGEKAANVWYRIHLTVTDSASQTQTSFRDVRPWTAILSLATSPPGLRVSLDGQPVTTPISVTSVVGMHRTLGALSPQTLNGTTYQFSSWSDGGAATHTINSPAANTTYTAAYQVVSSVVGTPAAIGANDGVYPEKVRIVWSSVSGASYYRVYRASTAGGPKTALSPWRTSTSFDDTTGTPGVIYYYSAQAAADSNGGRAGNYSVEDPGWRALTPPGGVAASDATYPDRVAVRWNSTAGATHYRVSRATSAGGTKTALSGWIAATTYNDTSASPGVTYYYSVQAAVSNTGLRVELIQCRRSWIPKLGTGRNVGSHRPRKVRTRCHQKQTQAGRFHHRGCLGRKASAD